MEEEIKIKGKRYSKSKFLVEENHPAIGRILIIENLKFKILDEETKFHKSGTFIAPLTEEDEERMREYDEEIETLSEKLVDRVDVKRLIKENIKHKTHQEIKTGLFILKAKDKGEQIEEEHLKGCYQYQMHYKNQTFDLISGSEVLNNMAII